MSQEKTCRYCLEDDNIENMVSPCKCKGCIQYVHKICLLEWISLKISQDHSCEICYTPYKLIFKKEYKSLPKIIFIYIVRILITYLIIGYIAFYKIENVNLGIILCNGFIFYTFITGLTSVYTRILGVRRYSNFLAYLIFALIFICIETCSYCKNKDLIIISTIMFFGILENFLDIYKIVYKSVKKITIDILNY